MVHNGVGQSLTHNGVRKANEEFGLMSAQVEALQVMNSGLGMTYGKALHPNLLQS